MKLLGQVFNRGDDAGCGAIHRIADQGVTAVTHGIQNAPSWEAREGIEVGRCGLRMGFRENQKFGLLMNDFFET